VGELFDCHSRFEFSRCFSNSINVTIGSIAGTLFSSSLSAYALVAYKVRGKNLVFALLMATLMLPAQVTVIPLFKLYAPRLHRGRPHRRRIRAAHPHYSIHPPRQARPADHCRLHLHRHLERPVEPAAVPIR
jgi:ABC-type glycerol-3-phosphate transport system permease component